MTPKKKPIPTDTDTGKKKPTPASTGKKTRNRANKIIRTRKVVAKAVRKSRVAKPKRPKAKKPKDSSKSISRNRATQAHKNLKALEEARDSGLKVIIQTGQTPQESDNGYDSWATEFDITSDAEYEANYRDADDAWLAVQASLSPSDAKELVDRPLTDKQWDRLNPHVSKLLEHPKHANLHTPDYPVWVRYSWLGYLRKMERTQKVSLDGIDWLGKIAYEAGDALFEIADQMRREVEEMDPSTDVPAV